MKIHEHETDQFDMISYAHGLAFIPDFSTLSSSALNLLGCKLLVPAYDADQRDRLIDG